MALWVKLRLHVPWHKSITLNITPLVSLQIVEAQNLKNAWIDFKTYSAFNKTFYRKNNRENKKKKGRKKCFCFLPVTNRSNGGLSDMQNALPLKTVYSYWKFERSFLHGNSFWEKSWTRQNIKSLISRNRKWLKSVKIIKTVCLDCDLKVSIGSRVFQKTWQKNI